MAYDTTLNDKRATAFHEAGHVVAHIRLGIAQGRVTIVPGGERLGAVAAEGVQHVWYKDQAGSMVIAFGAGYAALVAAGYGDDEARAGAGDDFVQAEHLIDFWGLAGDLNAWLTQAMELMRRPENVAAVASVAEHLMKHETLDVEYLEVLVDVADGRITEAEFARYLELRRWSDRGAS